MTEMLVSFDGVSKYFNDKLILDNINFNIANESITTLIGPNGAGKTTLARILVGLDEPSIGKVTKSRNLRISYVPQKINLSKHMPLRPCDLLKSLSLSEVKIFEFDIVSSEFWQNIREKQIHELSGGQLQKLLILVALLNNANLIVFDEATANLDYDSEVEFYNWIISAPKKFKLSVFMISHDLHMVLKESTQVLCLNKHICCKKEGDIFDKRNVFKLDILEMYEHKHNHKH